MKNGALLSTIVSMLVLCSACSLSKDAQTEQTTLESETSQKTEVTTISETSVETTTTTAETISSPIDGITELYRTAFLPFADGIGTMTFEEARTIANSLPYKSEITIPTDNDLGQIKIIDESGDYVWMMTYFNSSNIETLSCLTYHHNEYEISTGDEYHGRTIYFNTYDKNRERPNKKVSSLKKCELFMFGCNSDDNNE